MIRWASEKRPKQTCCSAEVHGVCHAFVRMSKARALQELVLAARRASRSSRIGGFRYDIGHGALLALLWVVVVFGARAHLVGVWFEMSVVCRKAMLEIKWKGIYSRQEPGRRSSAWSKRGYGRGRTREIGGHRACNTVHKVVRVESNTESGMP